MRNLKKILALVLSLMMVLSVMVTASAADYSDADDIQYTEAVEVMSNLGILAGDGNKFAPQGTLTRSQAAKIITYVALGADAANLVKGTGSDLFTDVSGWAYDYISYCANEGIINGAGDGKFYPNAEVTGYQFGKMLLNVLGIEGTYTGSGWTLNVAKALKNTGLLDNMAKDFSLTNNLTREEAAQLAFDAMNYGEVVEKNVTSTKYVIVALKDTYADGDIGKSYDTFAEAQLAASTAASGAVSGAQLGKDYNITSYTVTEKKSEKKDSLGLDNYGLYYVTTEDNFGRPVTVWYSVYTPIAKVMQTPVATYNTTVKGVDLYADFGLTPATTGYFNFSYVVDGKADSTTYTSLIAADSTATIGGVGTDVEIYYTGINTYGQYSYKFVVVNTYVDTIKTWNKAVTNAAGQITTKESVTLNAVNLSYSTTAFSKNDEATAVKDATVVLYTKAWVDTNNDGVKDAYRLQSVKAAESGKVTVTGLKKAGANLVSINADKLYLASANYTTDTVNSGVSYSTLPTATNEYTVWFDSYGNVIAGKPVTDSATTGYALVLAVTQGQSAWSDGSNAYQAKLLMADGTEQTVATDMASYNAFVGTPASNTDPYVVMYTVNAKGEYVFNTTNDKVGDATALAVSSGVAKVTVATSTDVYANSKTVFFVGKTGLDSKVSWTVVTGIANMDSVVKAASGTKVAYLADSSVLNAVAIVDAAPAVGTSTVDDVAYLIYNANATETVDATGTYKTYVAVINGKVTTVNVDSTAVSTIFSTSKNVLVAALKYDNKTGLVTGVETDFHTTTTYVAATSDTIATAYANGVVKMTTNGILSVADTCEVYVLENGTATVGALADLARNATVDYVTVGSIIVAAYVTPAV